MTLKRTAIALTAVALCIVVCGCFVVQLCEQKSFSYTFSQHTCTGIKIQSGPASLDAITINPYIMLGVPPVFGTQTATATNQSALTNATRSQIFSYIDTNPGVAFRSLCAALCLPVGLAEYHLGVLVRSGLVSFVRDGRYKRFFVSKRFSKREMLAICLLRHTTAKRIIETLMKKGALSHGKLAIDVSITSQALTWQMKTLANTEFVSQSSDGLKIIYRLDAASTPQLKSYLALINCP
ncbi:MAG: hypothetical protein NWE92_04125 [Candidatus Bathyarchaeota archaeon]|nr:hypothetical protein [Candidatus Bathyarchaeota archaeon]